MIKTVRTSLLLVMLILSVNRVVADDCSKLVSATWLDEDGRKMRLDADYSYVDPSSSRWLAPKNSVVDGASIPPVLWFPIGSPFVGKYRKASVVHDVACEAKDRSWRAVHRMFYDHMICSGVDPAKAKVMYWAVFHCGPRWGQDQGVRLVPCAEALQLKNLLAAIACIASSCPESEFPPLASGLTLGVLEELTTSELQNQPQMANFDLSEPLQDRDEIRGIEEEREIFAMQQRVANEQTERRAMYERQRIEMMQAELEKLAQARTDERGFIVTLPGLLFDVGNTTLKPGARNTLVKIAEQLRTMRELEIQVEGHTDSVGSDAANLAMSKRRAAAVEEFLISKGVDPAQITSVGKGEEQPVASNSTPAGRQQNRRVEIIINRELPAGH